VLRQGITYIQSGTGIACRIDFPNIKQLKVHFRKGAIVDAELIIKPIKTPIQIRTILYLILYKGFLWQLNMVTGTFK
jgi:hypothetical protein